MSDRYETTAIGMTGPATRHYAITPSDSADLPVRPRAIYCKASGDIVIRDDDGTQITYTLAAGDVLPIRAVRILATGTTATVVGWD